MIQTVAKRRTITIASIVIAVLVISSIIALVDYNPLASTQINLSLSSNQINVAQGGNSKVNLAVTSIGKAENVTLSSDSGLNGINCTFEPNSGESNFTSTLTIGVSDSTPTGNYSVIIIASEGGKTVKASIILSVLYGDVIVSGRAGSAALSEPEITSIQKIEFTDVQTGIVTSFNFPFAEQSNNPFGNYSVTLKNGHTYNVTISYYAGFSVGNMSPTSDYIETFTVHAFAGQTTTLTEDFT